MTTKDVATNAAYEDWLNRKWRPVTAWVYIIICLFDFVVGPIITFYFFGKQGGTYTQWQPLTLMGAGTLHLAMGAIIGITAWQRGSEKINRYRYQYDPRRDDTYYDEESDTADYRERILSDRYPKRSYRENGRDFE